MSDALRAVQSQVGAVHGDYSGRPVVRSFGDTSAECRHVRQSVGLLDLSWTRLMRFVGEERASWLHGLTTNHVLNLVPGGIQRNTCCDMTGHLVGVLRLLNTGDALWADMHPGCASAVAAILDGHLIMEDVEIDELNDGWGMLSMQGPASEEAFRSALALELPAPGEVLATTYENKNIILASGRWHSGEYGVDLMAPAELLPGLWEKLCVEAKSREGGPVGLDALEVLRVEAGIPWWGEDLNNSVLMLEAGLEDAIHYQKGCYLGQETLARVHFRGHTNRELTGLLMELSDLPEPGARLLSGDREVGRITSAVHSMTLNEPIAMGFVRRELCQEGTELSVDPGKRGAIVTRLPFVKWAEERSKG